MRDVIFISHATPEDNEFVIWLSSRLQLMGYKVWCDLRGLIGGEKDFWKVVDEQIRTNSCKFLLVVSRHTFLKDGVIDEFSLAKSIAKESNIQDFVMPLRIEKVPFNDRIGINVYNHLDFSANWEDGLKQLLKKFIQDGVPFSSNGLQEESKHFFNQVLYSNNCSIKQKPEIYYTNLWEINRLPEELKIFHYETEAQAKAVLKEVNGFPVVRHGNVLACFSDKVPTMCVQAGNVEVIHSRKYNISVTSILNGYESNDFPTHNDSENLLKRILATAFYQMMSKRGLGSYRMANMATSYYYPINLLPGNKVNIIYHDRIKQKNLVGKQYDGKWHFAVSSKVQLKPFVCFNLKSHILFSNEGVKLWDNPSKQHSARRKKGKTWFNEQWRDQLMAFLAGLRPNEGQDIELHLGDDFIVKMSDFTKYYNSDFGYSEPETNSRQNIINDYEEKEEEGDSSSTTIIGTANE